MDPPTSSSGPHTELKSSSVMPQKETCQRRTILNQHQRNTLQAYFDKNPYVDKATREKLSQELDISGASIQNWFRSQRLKQKKLHYQSYLAKGHTQNHDQPQMCTQEHLSQTAARQPHKPLTETQGKSPFPEIDTKTRLANGTDRGSSIQTWFPKETLLPTQSTRKPLDSWADDTNGSPNLTTHQQQLSLFAHPGGDHVPNFSGIQNSAPPQYYVSWDSLWTEEPNNTLFLLTQKALGGETLNPPPEPLTPGKDVSKTQVPSWHQYNTSPGDLQPLCAHEEQPSMDVESPDISYIMQWWDKGRQELIAEWEPKEH
ncbi:double homeobox protein B-like [Dipodomys merriami]|uniref:double homeobox protein B-like n=1 Tax=Dipodomys merriami TaxID=94247 RepID=UPI0038558AEB